MNMTWASHRIFIFGDMMTKCQKFIVMRVAISSMNSQKN